MLENFHFLRPWLLLLWIPGALLIWGIHRRQDAAQVWEGIVASHLLPFLLSGHTHRRRVSPPVFIGLGWFVGVLAIAGPTWRQEPAPFADDTAALAIVIRVSPSVKTEDVPPSRLARSVQKIHDLLAERRGAKTALIAYSGSAHVVMPATTDAGIVDTFAQALDPKIMPADGDVAAEALRLADQTLASSGAGSILWITDSLAPEQETALAAWRAKSPTPVRLLPPLLPGAELDALAQSARAARVTVVRLTADQSDVMTVARAAKFAAAATGALSERWQESGYWLTPVLVVLLLPFFRRGWMVPTAARG